MAKPPERIDTQATANSTAPRPTVPRPFGPEWIAPKLTGGFWNFPNLPGELRLQIWQHNIPENRFIEVRVKETDIGVYVAEEFTYPAILLVNQEFGDEGLKYYEVLEIAEMVFKYKDEKASKRARRADKQPSALM